MKQFSNRFFAGLQAQGSVLLEPIQATCHHSLTATDAEARPLFVSSQALLEDMISRSLQYNLINGAVCIIHTPTPPTPLRTDVKEATISDGIVTQDILDDPARLKTVTD